MRVEGFQGGFLPLSGGSLSGPLTIDCDSNPPLTVKRTTGAANAIIDLFVGGTKYARLFVANAAPHFRVYNPGQTTGFGYDLTNDKFTLGTVPLARMQRAEVTATNAGAVTLLAGLTSIVSLNLGNVVAGDRIVLKGAAQVTKGATSGATQLGFKQTAGTATVQYQGRAATAEYNTEDSQANGTTDLYEDMTEIEVTASGSLTVDFQGLSAGSNGTIGIGQGAAYALVLIGV